MKLLLNRFPSICRLIVSLNPCLCMHENMIQTEHARKSVAPCTTHLASDALLDMLKYYKVVLGTFFMRARTG